MTLRAADGCCCGAQPATRLRGRRMSVTSMWASALRHQLQNRLGKPPRTAMLMVCPLTLGASATCGTSMATGDDLKTVCSCWASCNKLVSAELTMLRTRRRKLSVYRMDIDRQEAEAADQAAGEQAAAEGAQAAFAAAAGRGGQDGAASHLELYDEFGQRQSSRFQQVHEKACNLPSRLAQGA